MKKGSNFSIYNRHTYLNIQIEDFYLNVKNIMAKYDIDIAKLKEKDIAILRTLGASKTDVFKIFLLQNVALWFGMTILGLAGTIILSSIIINIPFFNFVNFLYLLDINPLKVILVLVVAFGVSLLGITIPFIKIIKKSPIDVLKCEE